MNSSGKPEAAGLANAQGNELQSDMSLMDLLSSPEGQMAIQKLQAGQRSGNTNAGMKYSQAPDMSQYANMGSLMNMMPQQQQKQKSQAQGSIDPYLMSLLGG